MTITLDLGHALASPSFHPRHTKLSPSKKRRLERRAEARAKAAENARNDTAKVVSSESTEQVEEHIVDSNTFREPNSVAEETADNETLSQPIGNEKAAKINLACDSCERKFEST